MGLSQTKLIAKAGLMACLLWISWSIAFSPVLTQWQSEQDLARTMAFGSPQAAERILAQWHRVDPYSDQAWQRESQIAFSRWQKTKKSTYRTRLLETIEQGDRVRPGVAAKYRTYAQGFFVAFRQMKDARDLEQAVEFQTKVTFLAPTDAFAFAQLHFPFHYPPLLIESALPSSSSSS